MNDQVFSINSTDLVTHFIEYYTIWRDYQKFYKKTDRIGIQHCTNGHPCFHYMDINGINNCKNSIVVIDNLAESVHSKKFFVQYNQDKLYLIFSAGWWDIETLTDLKINYKLIYFPWFLVDTTNNFFNPHRFSCYINKSYKFEDYKQYSFVGITGNVRPERDLLLTQILDQVKHKNFIYRYSGQDFMATTPCESDVTNFVPGNFDPYTDLYKKYFHTVSDTIPIDLYNLGHFLLLTETDIINNNCFFITEKTIKALATGIPFVMAATPNFLKFLREMGFETYSTLWDESYDSIEDTTDRLKAVAKICNSLHDFDWAANKTHLEMIAHRNKSNFLNINSLINKCFVETEKTINELVKVQKF
jgi:hypothetical protein